jgi:pilus assembly protein CpaB
MMHFDRRFVTVMSMSLLWALVVSFVFYRLAGSASGPARAAAEKQVVVATRSLGVGSTLDRASVKLRGVPENLFPAGAFSRVEDVLERPVISAIQAEEPVVEARLAAKGSGMGLGPMIPPGMRAISVRVNDVVGVAGFVLPGMRVDVLVTGKPPNRADTETQTVLQNITVLSAGQTVQGDGRREPMVVQVVTLLVTPAEAEALTLSNIEGRIQLVLRNSTDHETVATHGRRLHELYGAASLAPVAVADAGPPPASPVPPVRRAAPRPVAPPAVAVAPPHAAPAPEQMMVIRGAVKKIEVFDKEQDARQDARQDAK